MHCDWRAGAGSQSLTKGGVGRCSSLLDNSVLNKCQSIDNEANRA